MLPSEFLDPEFKVKLWGNYLLKQVKSPFALPAFSLFSLLETGKILAKQYPNPIKQENKGSKE